MSPVGVGDTVDEEMAAGVRYEPPTIDSALVVRRTRVVARLEQRFEHRITTVVGAAGYGKSTALALAIENTRLDPAGRIDHWLSVAHPDVAPTTFLSGLATAVGVEYAGTDDATMDRIVEALWSLAPNDVAVFLDDADRLNGSPTIAVLRTLVTRLPENAHVVLASRVPVDLPVARLRALGRLLEITESDLSLDDDELAELRERRGSAADVILPRHPATADLRLVAGVEAGADFLWEEILATYDPDRLAYLRRVALLDEVDDHLVDALTDGAVDATELLADIPLVDRHDDGGHRMHDILRSALIGRVEPGERRKSLSVAADAERARERFPKAVELYLRAGDPIGALDAAREFTLAPTMLQSLDDVRTIRRLVEPLDASTPVGYLLEAISHFGGLEDHLVDRFAVAADAARSIGDEELEALALHRMAQAQMLGQSDDVDTTVARLEQLAETNTYARGVRGYVRSILHQLDGDLDAALASLGDLHHLPRSTELVSRSERLYDLGRPEQVAAGLQPSDLADLPPGATAFIGLSLWTRGDSAPDLAALVVDERIAQTLRQGFTHPAVNTLAIATHIALANRETALAKRYAEHAGDLSTAGVAGSFDDVVLIAQAALAAVRDGDEAAAAILRTRRAHPEYVDEKLRWPLRCHLASLALVYVCQPVLRPMLEGIDIGPSLRTAVEAGAAIVSLRERDDPRPAADLPWNQADMLRANVLPTHLVELACAAVHAENSAAGELLDVIPDPVPLLERVFDVSSPCAIEVASQRLGDLPEAEPFTLHARLLGPVELLRSGEAVDTPHFVKRPKVRELFALLVSRRRMERRDLVDLLWPDSDEARALASLRTTLSTLNNVLDPDRAHGASAFHLSVDGESVTLDARVTHDVVHFEQLIESALADDRAGLPAQALVTYIEAMGVYRGDYLTGIEASWVVLDRLRLRSLALRACCRISELTGARGEPEQAMKWATQARSIDPLNERAGRQFAASLDASGDRSAARVAAAELVASLRDADVSPEPETLRLVTRLG